MESIEGSQSNKMQQLIDESKTKISCKKKEFVEEMVILRLNKYI